MRNEFLLVLLFIVILPAGCTMPGSHDEKIGDTKLAAPKDTFHKLCQYWEVTDAENPSFRDVANQPGEGVVNIPGIIFMTDSTFLENPKAAMRYGKFELKGKVIDAQFDDGKKAIYNIQDLPDSAMIVRRVEKDRTTVLHLTGAQVFWPDAAHNPFNKSNSLWRIKPAMAESTEGLRERLRQCVRFYEYFFQGYATSDADEIDFLGLPSCFKWYQGGIFVQGPKHLDKKWIDCFYSEEQAMQARQIMEDVVLKKYAWDTTQKNWIKQTAAVLKQIHDKI